MENNGRVESSGSKQIPVLLLKTRSMPIDGYDDYFKTVEDGKYNPTFVPVLEHKFREESLDWLRNTIVHGGFTGEKPANEDDVFGSIIFTSQRAVEGFTKVVESLDQHTRDQLLPPSLPLYVVGPATAKGLRAIGLQCPIVGEETGNGEALAAFMLEDYPKRIPTGASRPPILFLVGEQRRDIIPKTLQSPNLPEEQRIRVVESTVYETGEMESFQSDFESRLRHNAEQQSPEQWIVVFSPTGCKAMLRSLDWLSKDTGRYDGSTAVFETVRTRVATIGPTTRDYLIREFEFQPHVCAEIPSAEGIGKAIVESTR